MIVTASLFVKTPVKKIYVDSVKNHDVTGIERGTGKTFQHFGQTALKRGQVKRSF